MPDQHTRREAGPEPALDRNGTSEKSMTHSSDTPSTPSRPNLSIDEVSATFRELAEDHASQRELEAKKLTWDRLEFSANGDARAHPLATSKLRYLIPVAAALCAAAAVILLFLRAPLEYELQGGSAQGELIRTYDKAAALAFSDGSRVDVTARSALSVELLGPTAARAHLVEGALKVHVKHQSATDYRFMAGPYEVRVVGTRFRLAWDPRAEIFVLEMYEGKVRVLGPRKLDRVLSSGESLRFSAASNNAMAQAAPQKSPSVELSSGRAARPMTDVGRAASASGQQGPAASAALEPDWAGLVSKGRFTEVVQAAKALGTDRVLVERSARDLNALAHSAHYTGQSRLAVSAWRALRQRFAQASFGRQAAFFLGRVHDQEGRPTEALRWLDAYLSEAPGDVYASEALGRKIALVQKVEGLASARKVAREYLQRFPKGTYARAARAIVAEP